MTVEDSTLSEALATSKVVKKEMEKMLDLAKPAGSDSDKEKKEPSRKIRKRKTRPSKGKKPTDPRAGKPSPPETTFDVDKQDSEEMKKLLAIESECFRRMQTASFKGPFTMLNAVCAWKQMEGFSNATKTKYGYKYFNCYSPFVYEFQSPSLTFGFRDPDRAIIDPQSSFAWIAQTKRMCIVLDHDSPIVYQLEEFYEGLKKKFESEQSPKKRLQWAPLFTDHVDDKYNSKWLNVYMDDRVIITERDEKSSKKKGLNYVPYLSKMHAMLKLGCVRYNPSSRSYQMVCKALRVAVTERGTTKPPSEKSSSISMIPSFSDEVAGLL